MDKRNLGRFCIQFNTADARHLQVIELLEAQGRRKAQYLSEAVLHYINCKETPDMTAQVEPSAALFKKQVESIVWEILRQNRNVDMKEETAAPEMNMELPVKDFASEYPMADRDEDLFASIRESISALRDNEME